MTWIRANQHTCNLLHEGAAIGDRWLCDICGALYEWTSQGTFIRVEIERDQYLAASHGPTRPPMR